MHAHCNVNSSEGFAAEPLAWRLRFGVGGAAGGASGPARLRDPVAAGGFGVVHDSSSINLMHDVILDVPDAPRVVDVETAQNVPRRVPLGGNPATVRHRNLIDKNDDGGWGCWVSNH